MQRRRGPSRWTLTTSKGKTKHKYKLRFMPEALEEWRNLFPGKTPHEVSLLLAAANFLVKANGKLLAENERLREQRPLTAEEKALVEKAWQEYRNAEKPAGKDTSLFANMLGRDA